MASAGRIPFYPARPAPPLSLNFQHHPKTRKTESCLETNCQLRIGNYNIPTERGGKEAAA